MSKVWLHRIGLFLLLYACWLVFSGIYKPLLVTLGAVCAAFTVYLTVRMDVIDHEGHPLHLTHKAPLYWLWLLKEIILSGWTVSKECWRPVPRISPAFGFIPSRQTCDVGRTIFANSITLTPGTASIRVEEHGIFVHALQKESIDDLLNGRMDTRIFDLVVDDTLPPHSLPAAAAKEENK
jgi:multicomponent Na+:H+ antiporter subunit E